ncbi:Disease resistance protein [Penicillium frequentans]|nr:Disease resistance protein [Penicillium glabrum]
MPQPLSPSCSGLNARSSEQLSGLAELVLKRRSTTIPMQKATCEASLYSSLRLSIYREIEETARAVKRWLEEPTNDRWLIVYDNYDNPLLEISKAKDAGHASSPNTEFYSDEADGRPRAFDLRQYLPKTDHGAIIVTTRSSLVNLGQPIFLGKLANINDSLEILASGSRREGLRQDPAAFDIARRLDGLPLALATAGAYLKEL